MLIRFMEKYTIDIYYSRSVYMLNNNENYSKKEVEQAKRDIQSLVKEKSKHVKIDFSNKKDVLEFFDNE